jgi:cytochrome c oxidase cbb3-type subunit 3
MLETVSHGRPGTAMKAFANTLSGEDIALVVDFVRQEFMTDKAKNTRYHIPENGWPNHQQYAPAFPFALGQIALDRPVEELTPQQQLGRRIFMQSCVTCHDRGHVEDEGVIWDPRPVSFPRSQYSHHDSDEQDSGHAPSPDSVSSATPYARHDQAPSLADASEQERQGEELFQNNCAFCHAADGTGKNWIGSFLQPHPRNLTDPDNMRDMTAERLRQVIRNGLPGATMPAWKSVLTGEQIESVIAYINKAFHPIKNLVATKAEKRLDSGTVK